MKNTGKYLLLLPFFALFFLSCDRYNKILKSSNYEFKLEKAMDYYKKENYVKALQLFDELIPIYKGSDKAEDIYYCYSYANFYQGDFQLAQYHFKNFVRQFPGSPHVEESYYMSAYCYSLSSPNFKLDQTDTKAAIKEFQAFIDEFPESKRIDTCNILVDNLRQKLERKDYELTKQYFKLSDYKAVITQAKIFMKEFPDSKNVEEMHYLIINSYYLLAINSIPSKKIQRLDGVIESYLKFVDLYPKSSFLAKAEDVYNNAIDVKQNFLKKQ